MDVHYQAGRTPIPDGAKPLNIVPDMPAIRADCQLTTNGGYEVRLMPRFEVTSERFAMASGLNVAKPRLPKAVNPEDQP